MEAIHAKLIQLERQLEQRDKALVLIARQLNMKLQAGEMLAEEDHQRLFAVMAYVRNILDEEGKRMKVPLLDLLKREQANSKELQENRQELIQVKVKKNIVFLKFLVALFSSLGGVTLLLEVLIIEMMMIMFKCAGF